MLNQIYKLLIGNKEFNIKYVGQGCVNKVYEISNNTGQKLCYKVASDPFRSVLGHGIHNEAAITKEANDAGVVDVSKLYMTNLLPKGEYTEGKELLGGWQLTNFIDNTKTPKDGLKLRDWLKSKGLFHSDLDDHKSNSINGFVVDMGGILSDVKERPYSYMVNVDESTFHFV